MTYREPLSQMSIAISVSDSADMGKRGLGPEHLRDAMAEIARHLLAMGARLIYGGDVRTGGFTELLFELVARHRRDADEGDQRPAVMNYLAWPVYARWPSEELNRINDELGGIAQVKFLDRDGRESGLGDHVQLDQPRVSDADWSRGLTAMRQSVTRGSDARILLGGRVSGFMGSMPGIAEEAIWALAEKQPLFVLGGFGGCAFDIASHLGLVEAQRSDAMPWAGRELFFNLGPQNLRNGLSDAENRALAKTVHVDEAVGLILRGLLRLTKKRG